MLMENSLNIGRRDCLLRHVSHQVTCCFFMPVVENAPFKGMRQQWSSHGVAGPPVLHLWMLSNATGLLCAAFSMVHPGARDLLPSVIKEAGAALPQVSLT